MKIVFNTSPLIFLSRLEMLDIFLSQMEEFYAPKAVVDEIFAKEDDTSQAISEIFHQQMILSQTIQLSLFANRLSQRLGKGESEAITLALELEADYIILDDFAARREAIRLGLKPKGTLAIIRKLQADERITISNLDEFYQRLMGVGFRVKRSLFYQIFIASSEPS